MGLIRITGGIHRSRKIKVEDQPGLRPTADRVRETLFNWLGHNLHGWSVLDLYAGSGILALEAASRHASEVICVENNRHAVMQLKNNINSLQLEGVEVSYRDASQFVQSTSKCFDLIFLDPPFDSDELGPISDIISSLVKPSGFVYREYGSSQEITPLDDNIWLLLKHKQAGQVHFELWQKR
ncbi:16S rRNA (guanine(966)-N(2))-methyltransferase RsmD [Marinicella sp. S1101]|uniref:16S rRNA (guanine(966)-N(2))-methyltransferase RsmD n=1 Tax=Marinicella marina TaxID=2996016 RepID=UPI0022609268|nr:16S rRNA (guanine(966)-N(2))-methyltransferase RsmD [Marinicella marina]MCX7553027.1 16S rRNA (guanine(966)-N(2))-methyltransferase RsmD [Marinicella marina]MDJ1139663.1 16S rRNA (guanine(966)-N(2))-methyltransferase RsmD [Marinicella marina]